LAGRVLIGVDLGTSSVKGAAFDAGGQCVAAASRASGYDAPNYAKAWQSGPFLRYFINNVVQTVGILVCQLFFGCLAGCAFSRLRFPGRDACFLVVIACLIVPPQVCFIPLYLLLSHVGLINTYAALILPYAVSALGTFLAHRAPYHRGVRPVQRGLSLERLLLAACDDDDRARPHPAGGRGHAAGRGDGRALAHHHGGQHVRHRARAAIGSCYVLEVQVC
jgi:hypothetical protein